MSPIRAIRSFGNKIGLAWWAKIETSKPDGTYWFGPFMTRRSLKNRLGIFVEDLSEEGPDSINHSIVRCRRGEPLTI